MPNPIHESTLFQSVLFATLHVWFPYLPAPYADVYQFTWLLHVQAAIFSVPWTQHNWQDGHPCIGVCFCLLSVGKLKWSRCVVDDHHAPHEGKYSAWKAVAPRGVGLAAGENTAVQTIVRQRHEDLAQAELQSEAVVHDMASRLWRMTAFDAPIMHNQVLDGATLELVWTAGCSKKELLVAVDDQQLSNSSPGRASSLPCSWAFQRMHCVHGLDMMGASKLNHAHDLPRMPCTASA